MVNLVENNNVFVCVENFKCIGRIWTIAETREGGIYFEEEKQKGRWLLNPDDFHSSSHFQKQNISGKLNCEKNYNRGAHCLCSNLFRNS